MRKRKSISNVTLTFDRFEEHPFDENFAKIFLEFENFAFIENFQKL